jgi:hypothetical protein
MQGVARQLFSAKAIEGGDKDKRDSSTVTRFWTEQRNRELKSPGQSGLLLGLSNSNQELAFDHNDHFRFHH